MNPATDTSSKARVNPGILYGVAAYAVWGLLPAFLKLLQPLSAPDILAYRILSRWCCSSRWPPRSSMALRSVGSPRRHGWSGR